MEILLEFLKVLLPWTAIVGAVQCINRRNRKRWNELKHQETENPSNIRYVIAYPPMVYRLFYVCIVAFVLLLLFTYKNSQVDLLVGVVFGGMSLLGVCGVLCTHVWKIWVDGDDIIYRGYNGIKHYYKFSDITNIKKKVNGAHVYYSGNRKLFKIDDNLVERRELTGQLMKRGVPCESENAFEEQPSINI